MSIKLRALSLSLVLSGIIPAPALAAVQDNSTSMLMRGAKQWLGKERPDLAKNMLKKLILIDPSSEEALYMLGNIELRDGNADEALKYLNKLEKVAPDSRRTRDLRNSYRAATTDKASLEKARALSNAGKHEQARKVLDQVFHGTPPRGELALEYYRITGYSKSGYEKAQNELAVLYKETGDSRYRLLQLELQANRSEYLASAIHGYQQLAWTEGGQLPSLKENWRTALFKLPDDNKKLVAIEQFLNVYKRDKAVTELQVDVKKNIASLAKLKGEEPVVKVATKKRQAAPKKQEPTAEEIPAEDPDIEKRTEALDALQDGNIEFAESSLLDLLKRRPNDPEVVGGLGFVKKAQGKLDEAEAWFTKALAIAKKKKGETARWQSLIEMAQFWSKLRASEALLKDNQLVAAEDMIQQALKIKPDNPNGLAVLARIKVAGNDDTEAERLYRLALEQEGHNVSATIGLVDLLSRKKRTQEALDLIEKTLQQYPAEWRQDPESQARLLREEAKLYVALDRPGQAVKALEQGVKADPKNPWVRFSLAKLYISLKLTPLALRVMQDGVVQDPQNAEMHYVQALVLLSLDDYAGGLDALNRIPEAEMTQPMRDARDRALIQYAIRQAENKIAQGNRRDAIRIMSIAQAQAEGNYIAMGQVADGWFKLGLQEQGLNAMRSLPGPAPLETQVHYATLLNRAKKDSELVGYLPSLQLPAGNDETSVKYRKDIRNVELDMAGRQFDRLMEQGKKEQAQQLADSVLNASQLSTADYFWAHRTYFYKAELPSDAISSLRDEKARTPDDLGIRWDLANVYYQDKQYGKAKSELQELLALTKPDDIDGRLRIARLQQNVGDEDGARRVMSDLTNRYPNNMVVLFQAGNMAQANGDYNEAMDYYEQTRELARKGAPAESGRTVAAIQQPADNGILLDLLPASKLQNAPTGGAKAVPKLASSQDSMRIYRSALASERGQQKLAASSTVVQVEQEMASIKARRKAKIETAVDVQAKQATNGTSTYNVTEIPVVASFPIGYEAQATVHVDKVDIDAGSLAAADATSFGTMKAYNYIPPTQLTPTTSGTTVGVGYEQGSIRADIGKVGIGFPVSNVVGGIHTGGSIGRMSYSLNLARRPYTGSQVSYSGVRDPVTGATWGGVTNTGVALYMDTKLHDLNVAGYVSYGLLRGKNVLNNDRLFVRLMADKDIYRTDDTVLNVGVNANFMSFAKNESGYTFGNGGYYSPQSSISVGLPVEIRGRDELLSYRLRAGVSYSKTHENVGLYYPTNPTLQAMAGGATYGGGNGGGGGYNLLGQVEYRIAPEFVLGGRFSMERSAYYAPNSLQVYLRYLFQPETGPVSMSPDPVVPYSQY